MVESLKRQNIALFLKSLTGKKKSKKSFHLKGTDLIRMIVKSKIIKMRVCSMIHQDQVWGKNFFSNISRKEKDKGIDNDARSEAWNLGNC